MKLNIFDYLELQSNLKELIFLLYYVFYFIINLFQIIN
jgi:hypothetical protein